MPRSSAARRLRRLGLCVLAYLLALGGLRWWWGCEADRRLAAKIDEYRRAGQPVSPEDFQVAPVADEENGALLLQRAAAKLATPAKGQLEVDDFFAEPELWTEKRDELTLLLQRNQEALDLLRQARGKPRADWKWSFTSPAILAPLPSLSPQRALAKTAFLAALHEHRAGSDAEAVEYVCDMLALGQATGKTGPTLIAHLVRIAIDALTYSTIEKVTPALRISGGAGTTQPTAAPAQPGQVRALIAELLDEEALRADWRLALYGERWFIPDMMECLASGRFTPAAVFGTAGGVPEAPWMARVLGPAWKLDTGRTLERFTAYVEAATAEDWPSARRLLPAEASAESRVWALVTNLSSMLMPSMEQAVQLHFRALASRRMAATALAIRLYEVDHGRRPATLAELVPDYLSAVPRDPYAPDGRALGYRPDASSPVLYCVGFDGADDGGRFKLRSTGSVQRDELDEPFFLDGNRPQARTRARGGGPTAAAPAASRTSTQAVDHDREVGDSSADEQGEQRDQEPDPTQQKPAP